MKISLSTYIIPSARVFIKEQKLFFTSKIGNTLLSMKVRINPWRILPMLLGIMLLGAIIIFSFSFSLFLKPITQWEWPSYALIGLWVVMSAILIIVTFTTGYYEVFKKYVVVHRGTKKLIYYYSDVVYIDEKQSEKKKNIHFFTRQGHARYLLFDKKGILYETMLQNCKNRLTEEEFKEQYPNVRL